MTHSESHKCCSLELNRFVHPINGTIKQAQSSSSQTQTQPEAIPKEIAEGLALFSSPELTDHLDKCLHLLFVRREDLQDNQVGSLNFNKFLPQENLGLGHQGFCQT